MLITAWEVVKHSPLSKEFPVDAICGLIETREENLKECFGEEFYDLLLCDVLQLPDADWQDWVEGEYSAGDAVVHNGIPYVANADTSTVPGTSTDWAGFSRFKNKEYNLLWEKYLRRYLAYDISIPALIFKKEAGDDNSGFGIPLTKMNVYKEQLMIERDTVHKYMVAYIRKRHEAILKTCDTSPFSTISFIAPDCSGTACRKPQRRILFKT